MRSPASQVNKQIDLALSHLQVDGRRRCRRNGCAFSRLGKASGAGVRGREGKRGECSAFCARTNLPLALCIAMRPTISFNLGQQPCVFTAAHFFLRGRCCGRTRVSRDAILLAVSSVPCAPSRWVLVSVRRTARRKRPPPPPPPPFSPLRRFA